MTAETITLNLSAKPRLAGRLVMWACRHAQWAIWLVGYDRCMWVVKNFGFRVKVS